MVGLPSHTTVATRIFATFSHPTHESYRYFSLPVPFRLPLCFPLFQMALIISVCGLYVPSAIFYFIASSYMPELSVGPLKGSEVRQATQQIRPSCRMYRPGTDHDLDRLRTDYLQIMCQTTVRDVRAGSISSLHMINANYQPKQYLENSELRIGQIPRPSRATTRPRRVDLCLLTQV